MPRYLASINTTGEIPDLELELDHKGFAFYFIMIRSGGSKIEDIGNGTSASRMAGFRSLKLDPQKLLGTTLTIETRALDLGPAVDQFNLSIKIHQDSNRVPLFDISTIGEQRVPNDEIIEIIRDNVTTPIDIDFSGNG